MKIGSEKKAAPVAPTARPAAAAASTPVPASAGKGWAASGAALAKAAGATAAATGAGPGHVDAELARLEKAMNGLGTDEKTVLQVLEKNPPAMVAAIAAQFGAKTGTSLRKALNSELSEGELRRGLKALDATMIKAGDATGTSGIAEKLLALRNQGSVSESELVNNYRPTENNKIDLLIQGKNAYPEVMKAVDGARDHIHVSFYIFSDDKQGNEFAAKLIAAKKRGVDVRVEMDGIGSQLMNPMAGSQKIVAKLEAAGIEVRKNHVVDVTRDQQVLNHPDHRKIVVVDGKIGFTGGMNMADHYVDQYHDVMVRAEGDVVKQMQSEWMGSWLHLGGKISGEDAAFKSRYFPEYKPGEAPGKTNITLAQHIPGENRQILATYLEKIDSAQTSIQIENPYCTNPDVQNALIRAAKRGVDVTVVLPGETDHAFSHLAAAQKYPEMIKSGVKIYEYPGFNHDKVMVTDKKFVTVGSSNLDDVALYHVYEMNLNVANEALAQDTAARLFEKDLAISKPMKTEDITKLQVTTGKFWNLFSHLI